MTKRAFNKIMQGIEEPRMFLDGTADKTAYRVHVKQRRPTLDEIGTGPEPKSHRPSTGQRATMGKPGRPRVR